MAKNVVKVIGYENKKGTFKNEQGKEIEYDNTYLYCTYENENTVGEGCRAYKLAKDVEFDNFNFLDDLVGNDVRLSATTTRYGTTVDVITIRE